MRRQLLLQKNENVQPLQLAADKTAAPLVGQ